MEKKTSVFMMTALIALFSIGWTHPTEAIAQRVSLHGTTVKLGGGSGSAPDYVSGISENAFKPRTSRGEDGSYWAVCRVSGPASNVRIYRALGDPATTAWVNEISLEETPLRKPDIEIVSSADRGFVVYEVTADDVVECFWWQLSDPSYCGFSDVGEIANTGGYISIESDEVEYNGNNVNLYAAWKYNDGNVNLYSTCSIDLGINWAVPTPGAFEVETMPRGSGISYDPGSNSVFIVYSHSASDDLYVVRGDNPRSVLNWTRTNVTKAGMTDPYTATGITSNYENYILVTSEYNNDIAYAISEDGGASWSMSYFSESLFDLSWPSCDSNSDGYHSILYYSTQDGGMMRSKRAPHYGMSGFPTAWTSVVVNVDNAYNGLTSACIEEGDDDPKHGGAWSTGNSSLATSYFGWECTYYYAGLMVDLIPSSTPVVIEQGSTFNYDIYLENGSTITRTFDFWIDVTEPGGTTTEPTIGPIYDIRKRAGWSRTYSNRNLTVSASAPLGYYSYNAYVGTHPDYIDECDNFAFEVIAGPVPEGSSPSGNSDKLMDEWHIDGDPLLGEEITFEAHPDELELLGAYPNPFNPTTNISFSLPQAMKVSLTVYDVSGRLVAEVINGWRDAGSHEVTFDGSGLASGVYVYNFHTGNQQTSSKMMLVK